MMRNTDGKGRAWEQKGVGAFQGVGGGGGAFQGVVLWKLGMSFLEESLCVLLSQAGLGHQGAFGFKNSSELTKYLPRFSSSLLQVAAKTLPFYKDYFNVPYPLPKIDLIAIADFAAGKVTHFIDELYFI